MHFPKETYMFCTDLFRYNEWKHIHVSFDSLGGETVELAEGIRKNKPTHVIE